LVKNTFSLCDSIILHSCRWVLMLVENICWRSPTLYIINYKGRGSLRQVRLFLEVQHNTWSATQTSWFIYLFIFLLGKSCGPQGCFLKCKTNNTMSICWLYFFVTRCTNQRHLKLILNFFLSVKLLCYSGVRGMLDIFFEESGCTGADVFESSLCVIKICM
jgi:hypothetical protein